MSNPTNMQGVPEAASHMPAPRRRHRSEAFLPPNGVLLLAMAVGVGIAAFTG